MNRKGQMEIISGFFILLVLILVFAIFMPIIQTTIDNVTFDNPVTGIIVSNINLIAAVVLLVLAVMLLTLRQ